jgi:hypothetical protein
MSSLLLFLAEYFGDDFFLLRGTRVIEHYELADGDIVNVCIRARGCSPKGRNKKKKGVPKFKLVAPLRLG